MANLKYERGKVKGAILVEVGDLVADLFDVDTLGVRNYDDIEEVLRAKIVAFDFRGGGVLIRFEGE